MPPDSPPPGSVSGDVVGGNKTVTQTAGGDIVGGDKITHTGTGHLFAGSGDVLIVQPQLSPANARDQANLRLLLNKVKTFWIDGVLERSVHNAFLLELGLELRTAAVDHPWSTVLELPDAAPRPLPAGTPIVQVFEQANRALLILGEPGSGKTITLLELARELIQRAEADAAGVLPIPVVFNLSTWHTQRQPLGAWMAGELASKYQIPARLGRAWLQDHRLLPLLDGLDEVDPPWRAACVAAINQYATQQGLSGIAVTCRVEEYTRLPARLRLNAAVSLSPLSPEQVRGYLAAGGERLAALRQVMQGDDVLAVLAQTPLFLSIMRLAYQDLPPAALAGPGLDTVAARRRHLLDQYVSRLLKRKGSAPQRYAEARLQRWTSWLARQMSAHSQTIYLVERMQPSWLGSRLAQWVYALATRVIEWTLLGFSLGTFQVLVFLAILFTDSAFAETVATQFPRSGLLDILGVAFETAGELALVGLAAGLLCALRFELSRYLSGALGCLTPVANLLTGSVLPSLLVIPLLWSAAERFGNPLLQLLVLGLLSVPVVVLSALAFRAWDSGHSATTDIPVADALHWSWTQSVLGAAVGFIVFSLIGSACMLAVGLGSGSTSLLMRLPIGGLPAGLVGAAGAGLVAGLRAKAIAGTPDSGRWVMRLARNVLAACLLFGFTMGLCGTLGMAAYTWLTLAGDSFDLLLALRTLVFGLACGLLCGTIAALYYGGVSLLRHIVLRLLLIIQRQTPLRLARIANQAEAAIFLRRVGGGYIFIHRLVQEHFAALPTH